MFLFVFHKKYGNQNCKKLVIKNEKHWKIYKKAKIINTSRKLGSIKHDNKLTIPIHISLFFYLTVKYKKYSWLCLWRERTTNTIYTGFKIGMFNT